MAQKEKLEEAKRLYQTANADQRYVLESLFPELKESKDEVIRKHLISLFEKFVTLGVANECETSEIKVDDILAWLEKQGKQKPVFGLRPQINVTDEELAQAKKEAYNEALDKIEYHSGEPTFDDGWSAAIWYLKKRNAQLQSQWKPSDEQMETIKKEIDKSRKV